MFFKIMFETSFQQVKKINVTDSYLCTFCQDIPDSIEHMFFQCEIIKNFWEEIQQELPNIQIPKIQNYQISVSCEQKDNVCWTTKGRLSILSYFCQLLYFDS